MLIVMGMSGCGFYPQISCSGLALNFLPALFTCVYLPCVTCLPVPAAFTYVLCVYLSYVYPCLPAYIYQCIHPVYTCVNAPVRNLLLGLKV